MATKAQNLIIHAKAYVDVRAGKLVAPANIVVEDGLIKAINPKTLPEGAEQINLPDKILMPGMMDMHVHLDMDFIQGYKDLLLSENAGKATLRGVKNAKKTLMAGFTAVRNVGITHYTLDLIDVALSEASDKGWIAAPRIIPCGHMIGITGGHADPTMQLGLSEGKLEPDLRYGIVDGTDEAVKAVRYQIKHGAKEIKIMATAGVLSLEGSVGAQQLSDEEMKAIVQEANRHGIQVCAHAHGTQGIIAAIKAGVHSIEHGSILNDEAIALMKEKNVFLVPTTGLVDIIMNETDKMAPEMKEKAEYVLPIAKQSVTKAINAGVNIALGTDAPLIPHGQNAYELQAMMDRGMTATEALKSATINPATLMSLKDRGEIKEGLLADIIAVDENPLDNIKTLQQVKFVMKGGVVYKNELD
jgi:imidazolonepropionase-like amidohydrolase